MRFGFRHTRAACHLGYVVQAIVNLFPPLLFARFHEELGVTLAQLSWIVTANFATQLATDLAATPFILRHGYRACMIAAQGTAAAGLVCLALLPSALPPPFLGILAAMVLSAIGGGLMEVLVSPVVQSLPSRDKVAEMNFLHSAYCWGAALVILVSTLLFGAFGIENWRWIALAWTAVPLFNGWLLARVPIATPEDAGGASGLRLRDLLRSRVFAFLALAMLCAGASELAMSQWASLFAELGLHVEKATGDLLGPFAFAVLMAASRLWFGFRSQTVDLRRSLAGTSLLCAAGYALAVFAPWPLASLAGCALCGLAVGLMWPGTFSLAAQALPQGGTLLFALLAFAGDLGCASGPGFVGFVSNRMAALGRGLFGLFGADPATAALKSGLFCAAAFPVALALLAAVAFRRPRARNKHATRSNPRRGRVQRFQIAD